VAPVCGIDLLQRVDSGLGIKLVVACGGGHRGTQRLDRSLVLVCHRSTSSAELPMMMRSRASPRDAPLLTAPTLMPRAAAV